MSRKIQENARKRKKKKEKKKRKEKKIVAFFSQMSFSFLQ